MKKIILCWGLLALGACQMKQTSPSYDFPKFAAKPHTLEKHKIKREDPYYWMRERENPEVVSYLQKEEAQAQKFFKSNQPLIDSLFNEMKSRTAEDEDSAPVAKKGYLYWSRVQKGQEHPAHYRRKMDPKAQEEMILDENELGKNSEFIEVNGPYISPKQDQIAYAVDLVGRRFFTLHFKNLKTGKVSKFSIPNTSGNLVWANDNETLFYTKQDPKTLRPDKLYRLHPPTQKSTLVYEEKNEEFFLGLSKPLSENFIFLYSSHHQTNVVRYIDANKPQSKFKEFMPKKKGVSLSLDDSGESFYVTTDEKAPNNKLYEVPYNWKTRRDWKLIREHRDDVFIANVDAIDGYLILTERKDGLNQIALINSKTLESRYVKFEDPTYMTNSITSGDFKRDSFRIQYESPRVPTQVIDIKLLDMSQTIVKQRPVPNFNANNYRTERVWVDARDGKKIPVSLVMKKNFKADGKSPLAQYAYGSYGYAMDPYFSIGVLSMVDRGFVYAIAHIRGGQDLGRAWYDDGRMQNKMNTFTDFIDVTEGLIKKGYAKKGHVYARGGSAGGLLMGAVANMRPDLYNGIVAEVPFVDVLTTMLDDTIPLTTSEYEEWGNPNIKEQYQWMAAYSPYDNVKKQAYPNMLIRTGFHDSQVQYWEPAKWTAKLRDMNTSKSLILFSVNMDAGHGGVTGRYKHLKEAAETMSFSLSLEGIKK